VACAIHAIALRIEKSRPAIMSANIPKMKLRANSHTRARKLFSIGAKNANSSDRAPIIMAFTKVIMSFIVVLFCRKINALSFGIYCSFNTFWLALSLDRIGCALPSATIGGARHNAKNALCSRLHDSSGIKNKQVYFVLLSACTIFAKEKIER
jgi:hypothetical protein